MKIYIGDKQYFTSDINSKMNIKMYLSKLSTVQKIIILKKGQAAQINTKKDNTVNWASQSPDIASVNSTGLVTGKKAGNAIITASLYDDEDQTSQCLVIVKDASFEADISSEYKTPYGFLKYLNPVSMVNTQISIDGKFYNYDVNNVNALSIALNQEDIVTNIKEGTNSIRITHDSAGEYETALNIIDSKNTASEQMIKKYKIIESEPTVKESAITKSENISDMINATIIDGGNYLTLENKTYNIQAPIIIPDNFTVNLNSSNIFLPESNENQCAFILNGNNSDIINGSITGTIKDSLSGIENGAIIFGKNSRYCSVKNINFSSIPYYAIQAGQRLGKSNILNNKINFHIYSEENIGRAISDYIDIGNYSKHNLYFGCFDGSMGLHSYNIFKCYEYDKDKKPIRNAVYRIYTRLLLQSSTKYIKIELYDRNITETYSLENIDVSYNNVISNCSFNECTLGGININMAENWLIKDCSAVKCGNAITAKYGYDMINGIAIDGAQLSESTEYDIDIQAGNAFEIINCTADNIYISQKARYVVMDEDSNISCITQEQNNTIIESHNFI